MIPPEALAAYLDDNLPDGIQVYGYPSDTITPPAVVIVPGDPFQAPYAMGGPGSMVWGLELKLVARRAVPQYSIRSLALLRFQVTELFAAYPDTVRWLALSDVDTIKIGDIDYLQGTLTVTLITADTGGT